MGDDLCSLAFLLNPSDNLVPDTILGYISVQGSRSVFEEDTGSLPGSSEAYHADSADRDQVRRNLEESGFTIYAESPLGFGVVSSPAGFEELTGGKVEAKERLMRAEAGRERYVTHLDIVGERQRETVGVAHARSEVDKIDCLLLAAAGRDGGVPIANPTELCRVSSERA